MRILLLNIIQHSLKKIHVSVPHVNAESAFGVLLYHTHGTFEGRRYLEGTYSTCLCTCILYIYIYYMLCVCRWYSYIHVYRRCTHDMHIIHVYVKLHNMHVWYTCSTWCVHTHIWYVSAHRSTIDGTMIPCTIYI